MRRALQLLPLLAFAPLGHFLGEYLDGAGVLPHGTGFLVSAASMFLLPWVVAALFLSVRVAWPIRVALLISALVAQGVLLFTVVPAGATSEMMGIAQRFRREYPPEQMRACAVTLVQKQHDRTLLIRPGDAGHSFLMSDKAILVDDSELPGLLRGRFERVFIRPDGDTGELRVYFALDERRGVVCDSRKRVRECFVFSMAEGVHAYRYERL